MTGRSNAEELARIYWADAEIEDIVIDYDCVALRVLQTDQKIATLRAFGYIGYNAVGFWDEMVIERAEVVDDHPELRACMSSINKRHPTGDTGSEDRNTRRWFAVLVHLSDGCVIEIFAARLVAEV